MKIGFHLTPFWSPTDRGATRIIDEAITVVAAASRMGFAWVSIGQHWVSHPTVWPQPFPILARLAPETGTMRLKTSVLLLPIVNAVETAENVATLDHICHGRLDVGVAIGYREKELEAVGLTRRDRAAKLEESLDLMKQLWTGREVTFHGKYTRLTGARMGFTPFQQPHPPLEMGAQSDGATRRAARLTDGVFFGPQVAWRDIGKLADGLPRGPRRERRHRLRQRRRLAEPHRRRRQGERAGGGARVSGEDVHDVSHVGDAGEDDGPAPALLRHRARRLDRLRRPARLRGDGPARPRARPRQDRLHDLQPAPRRPGPHRLPADDRRADPPSAGELGGVPDVTDSAASPKASRYA